MALRRKADIPTVRLKFCGGCKPRYDRLTVARNIAQSLAGHIQLVTSAETVCCAVVVVAGCRSTCVDVADFAGLPIYKVSDATAAHTIVEQLVGHRSVLYRHKESGQMKDWKSYYQERQVTAAKAALLVKSGDRIVTGHACGSPESLLDALVARAKELSNVEIVHMLSMGKATYCEPQYAEAFRHNSLFVGGSTRSAVKTGCADYTPCFFSEIPFLFRDGSLPVDVAMIMVSPPDKVGNVSLGVSVDYAMEAALSAKLVIAEVTPHMPRVYGQASLHVSDIDQFVLTDREVIEMQPPKIGPIEQAIGSHVASLIKDGDCLQLGIGAIPDATLSFLKDKKDLGVHSEMISDGVMALAEAGVITGRKKAIHQSKIVTTFAMGTKTFYQWLDGNSMVECYPVDYTNDPFVIARNDNVVSINSAISVDLMGQVAADTIGRTQFSGVGGQVDFVRGCRRSKGGRSIIAMPATAANGAVSRIVPMLTEGQAVTTSRNDVDYVVTEYGIARLRGKTLRERAEALIAIADPDFQAQLTLALEQEAG